MKSGKWADIGAASVILSLSAWAGETQAQSIAEFPYASICSNAGVIEHKKLIGVMVKEVDVSKAINASGQVDNAKLQTMMLEAGKLQLFSLQLKQEKGRFYRVVQNGKSVDTFDPHILLADAGRYQITCVAAGAPVSESAKVRKRLADSLSNTGDKLILRRDPDNFDKSLAQAAPASLAITGDRIKENTLVQSNAALATQFKFDVGFDPANTETVLTSFPVYILPYVRHEGTFNSNDRLRDVDNLGVGVMFDAYAIPTTSWLNNSISVRAEYLTDTANDKEVFASELVWTPTPAADVRWPIDIGQRIYFDEVAGGSSMRFDLSGRARYGWVENNAGITGIESGSEYLRLGMFAHADWMLGGDDIFAGLTAFADYWFFDNMLGEAGIDSFYRFRSGVSYAFSKNHGVELRYEKGRNQDTLQEIDQIIVALTVKFGDVEPSSPSFD
jgi:hypothetical protein